MKTFTPEQAIRVLGAAPSEGHGWEAFLAVAMTTGLRLGELVGLRWSDVDLVAGGLVVRQTIHFLPKIGMVVKAPKTATSRRPVNLGADVVALLKRHKASQNEQRLVLGSSWTDMDLVFPGELGLPLQDYTVRRAFARICKAANVPLIRIHDLRHTSATLLLAAGVNPKIVSERLGHSSVSLTLAVYSHVAETMQQAAAATLDTMLRQHALGELVEFR